VSSQKKAKGKEIMPQRPPFWLGYHALNAIACENGEPLEPTLSVSELVKFGMVHDEALEHLEAVPSFPYIPQEAWPSKRIDGKEGGHFNLTQVPFDVEVDEGGFALDYPTLKDKKWFQLHEEIVKDSFKRGYEFKITNVQKNDSAEFAWIKTPSPDQAKKIKTYKISFFNEIMEVNFASTEKLSEDDKARKNAVVLIAKNLNKTKTTTALEEGIKKLFGEENVAGIFFRLEKGKHVGSCNVQCLNAAVYKKYVKQNHPILGKYVEFSPHPKSLDGIDAPSPLELTRLGFADVNTALANTIQALENAPSKGYTKADLSKMVEEAVNKGAVVIRKEMRLLKEEIVEEANIYADKVQAESNRNSRIQIALLQKQMRITQETLQADHPDTSEIEGNMDTSN
jgi:hypothetical protein